jgi:hypothetical protein
MGHSFASYHLAKDQDAPRLAVDMGHVNPHMIFSNYRENMTPEEAERYWQILEGPLACTYGQGHSEAAPVFLIVPRSLRAPSSWAQRRTENLPERRPHWRKWRC